MGLIFRLVAQISPIEGTDGDEHDVAVGESSDSSGTPVADEEGKCVDTDGGARDQNGDGCNDGPYPYNQPENALYCGGDYDDEDFRSNEMCCGCGGGTTDPCSAITTKGRCKKQKGSCKWKRKTCVASQKGESKVCDAYRREVHDDGLVESCLACEKRFLPSSMKRCKKMEGKKKKKCKKKLNKAKQACTGKFGEIF